MFLKGVANDESVQNGSEREEGAEIGATTEQGVQSGNETEEGAAIGATTEPRVQSGDEIEEVAVNGATNDEDSQSSAESEEISVSDFVGLPVNDNRNLYDAENFAPVGGCDVDSSGVSDDKSQNDDCLNDKQQCYENGGDCVNDKECDESGSDCVNTWYIRGCSNYIHCDLYAKFKLSPRNAAEVILNTENICKELPTTCKENCYFVFSPQQYSDKPDDECYWKLKNSSKNPPFFAFLNSKSKRYRIAPEPLPLREELLPPKHFKISEHIYKPKCGGDYNKLVFRLDDKILIQYIGRWDE